MSDKTRTILIVSLLGILAIGFSVWFVFLGIQRFSGTGPDEDAGLGFILTQESNPFIGTREVLVEARFTPPAGEGEEWYCTDQLWVWGDDEIDQLEGCAEGFHEENGQYVFSLGHKYLSNTPHTVQVTLIHENGEEINSMKLEVIPNL